MLDLPTGVTAPGHCRRAVKGLPALLHREEDPDLPSFGSTPPPASPDFGIFVTWGRRKSYRTKWMSLGTALGFKLSWASKITGKSVHSQCSGALINQAPSGPHPARLNGNIREGRRESVCLCAVLTPARGAAWKCTSGWGMSAPSRDTDLQSQSNSNHTKKNDVCCNCALERIDHVSLKKS